MNVQPGLIDDHLEVYAVNGTAFCTYQQKVHQWPKFPAEVIDLFREDFENNEKAQAAIRDQWQITDDLEALHKYIICRFGGLDFFPDIANGKLQPDYHHCPMRSICPNNGVVCSPLTADNGVISDRERQVLVLIARGKMEKEIADELCIAMVTVKKHRQSLFSKTGAQSSVQLSRFAHKRNLIPVGHGC